MTRWKKTYRWEFRDQQLEKARSLEDRYSLHSVVASVLANRGLALEHEDMLHFMQPKLGTLHDPMLMKGMTAGANRVAEAVQSGEHIVVFGDYDADGITSTALMLRLLRYLGANCSFYVPHRVNEGYGMNTPALEQIARDGGRLVVTVDNGISGVPQVLRARELGLDVVITDHHQPGEELPAALAIINPNQRDCPYPCKHLAGVGVAFKFAHALLKTLGKPGAESIVFLKSVLDLVAIGTIADFAPLSGENRVLVSHGLQAIASSSHVGVATLCRHLKLNGPISAANVGFQIGPRLNAAGRTSHADLGVTLLTTDDPDEAAVIVDELEACNRTRRIIESTIFDECVAFVERNIDLNNEPVVVVDGHNWHLGVIGIVASRITDRLNRPVIVLTHLADHVKGSARSAGGFNLFEALVACGDKLTAFGGHPGAAGMTLPPENVQVFRQAVNAYARSTNQLGESVQPLVIDAEVECHLMNMQMMEHLRYLEPFGHTNPQPVLASRRIRLNAQPRVVGQKHLKIQFSSSGAIVDGIGFNMAEWASELNGAVGAEMDVAFSPTINNFWPVPRVEMEIKDLRLTTAAPAQIVV